MTVLAPALLALSLAQAAPPEPVAVGQGAAHSVLGGEELPVGNSQLLGWAGYPTVGFLYLQGLGSVDAGGGMQLKWDTGELEVTGAARLGLWRAGGAALALRARLGLYACFGAAYGNYAHRRDTGLLLVPGLAFSTPAGQGTFSAAIDLWTAVTSARGGGSALAPTASLAVEVPLVGDLTVGARFALSRRWDRGGAPGARRSPDDLVELVGLVGYRLF